MAVAGARGLIHDAVVNPVAMVSFHFLLRVFVFVPRYCRHAYLLAVAMPALECLKKARFAADWLRGALTAGPWAASGKPFLLSGWSSVLPFAARLDCAP